jgi:hypothetical protein
MSRPPLLKKGEEREMMNLKYCGSSTYTGLKSLILISANILEMLIDYTITSFPSFSKEGCPGFAPGRGGFIIILL